MTSAPKIQVALGRTGARLSLEQEGPRAASFGASNIEDAVGDVVRACVDLIRGRRDTGFLWRVDQSGVFVDIYLGAHWARLVVHDMKDYEWPMPTWFPERADVLFRLIAPTRQFMRDFTATVMSLPAQAASGGSRPLWARPLPTDLIDEVTRWAESGALDRLDDGTGRRETQP